ncbi:protein pob1 [Trichoderma asperellum]|uniref:Protein pob1 n=1 Tax=Trichoderma asperellum TaxID=101201 RepID=A0A6V8QPQ6_TRIAP|nr:protein pob1 [Trichoderma asperellum]
MNYTSFQAGESRTYQEMRQKPAPRDTFFNLKHEPQQIRPTSVATEFVDTDWDGEEDEVISEPEDNSPRVSLQSSGQPSFTTLSSYDEAPTPRSSRGPQVYLEYSPKQVEGPRGPHLFRFPADQYMKYPAEEDVILTLSPMTPQVPRQVAAHKLSRRNSPFQYTDEELDSSELVSWTPEMVAQSMLNAGLELAVSDRFIENDITGAILMTLKFEDLKELDISSFGIRTRVWHQIQALMDSRPASPRASTPIEDKPSREARKAMKKDNSGSVRRHESKRRQRRGANDPITPMESVSIIGIEQVIPKPHNCSKGEKCSKWRKQQRIIEEFKALNPHIDINTASGAVVIYGDAGNPDTARALDPNETIRPFSDSVPSVVASSDILGPGGLPPLQYLQEATLRGVQARDPQDNVRQFLNFQQTNQIGAEVPLTPPFEVTPPAQPHQGLRRLPKLSIPAKPQAARQTAPRASVSQPAQQQQQQHGSCRSSPLQQEFIPYQMDKADPLSPDLETAKNPYRFGTPFSEMDVPVTAVPIGPVARDTSQSVPPDMNYRAAPTALGHTRSQSRASARRPSFPVLPALDENRATRNYHRTTSPKTASPRTPVPSQQFQQFQQQPSQPSQAPPRFHYPWSPADRTTYETAIPPMTSLRPGDSQEAPAAMSTNGISFQGPMKKRKMRMLRHEWQDGYFTLKGTRLNMHKDAQQMDRTLEYVDIDDYAIACSSLASTSKLSAAFKAVSISHNREKSDPVGAFSFQLIPQDKNGARLRKRESSLQPNASAEGVNGTGKTHHFAVKGRDERIDWMRELMLAKALKQKGDGFEISVNGNMI